MPFSSLHQISPRKIKSKIQYYVPTFLVPPTVPERRYPTGVVVESKLCVCAISRWRGARELAERFLRVGFAHLPAGSPIMFRLEEMHPNASSPLTALLAHFSNRFDAYYLLDKVC